MADDQFERDQARLDRLAEAHVVGDQQVDPGHLDGPDHGVELVVLDVDARAERRLDVPTSAVEAAPQRTASRKASSRSGGSKPVGSGSETFLDDRRPRFDFPDDLQFLAEGVVLDREQGDEVLRLVGYGL